MEERVMELFDNFEYMLNLFQREEKSLFLEDLRYCLHLLQLEFLMTLKKEEE